MKEARTSSSLVFAVVVAAVAACMTIDIVNADTVTYNAPQGGEIEFTCSGDAYCCVVSFYSKLQFALPCFVGLLLYIVSPLGVVRKSFASSSAWQILL